jgi:hypothetical protein
VISGVLAILILVVNIRQPQIFTVVTSIGIIMIYISYLLVTAPMLAKRLRGEWPPPGAREQGYFNLGRLGLPINVVAVAWGPTHAETLGPGDIEAEVRITDADNEPTRFPVEGWVEFRVWEAIVPEPTS